MACTTLRALTGSCFYGDTVKEPPSLRSAEHVSLECRYEEHLCFCSHMFILSVSSGLGQFLYLITIAVGQSLL